MEEPIKEVEEKETPDIPADEAAGFASDVDDDLEDGLEGLDQEEPILLEDKVEKAEAEKPDDKVEKPDDKVAEGLGEDEEDDEDTIRGKELVAEQEKEETDKKVAEDAEKVQRREEGAYNPFAEQHDAKSLSFFRGIIPPNLLPDIVTLEDGTELNFKSVLETDPEIPVMITTIANNLIRQLVANKYLATNLDIAGLGEDFDDKLFMRTLTNKHDGVKDAKKIYNSEDFKKWLPEQPKEIQALLKSKDPDDHARLYKRFLGKSGLDTAKEEIAEKDAAKKAKKEKFDAIHKMTVKSKPKPKAGAVTDREEERAGFESKDDDDDFYS